jgi:hypothetical protein
MAARTGMANLITRLRRMTETTTADYTVGGVTYWSDDTLNDILDIQVSILNMVTLIPVREWNNGATEWHTYPIGWGNLEEQDSGVPYWLLTDSTGHSVSNTLYTADYQTGLVRFTADTKGVTYFLNWGRSYNIAGAAAEVWRQKLAHVAIAYDFKAEDQLFTRSQLTTHYRDMMTMYAGQGGIDTTPFSRSDLF